MRPAPLNSVAEIICRKSHLLSFLGGGIPRLPVIGGSFISEACRHHVALLLAVCALAFVVLEIALLYLGMKAFFGTLQIGVEDAAITISEKIPTSPISIHWAHVLCLT